MFLAILALSNFALGNAPEPAFPSLSFTADQLGQHLPPVLGDKSQNQPMAVHGALIAAGNAVHPIYNLLNPYAPVLLSTLESPYRFGEAESHQLAARVGADGTVQIATISGLGVDLWDITDLTSPTLLAAVELEGINYGDNTEAVWGTAWEGDTLFVGGTSTGLHVLDTRVLTNPVLVARLTQAELGGVSAGPLWAVGQTLVITTPKDRQGVVTLDISDPHDPAVLDFVIPDKKSYIGGFYGRHAQLISPLRTYDVLTDPSNITLISTLETATTEYVSYGDGYLFLGALRPNPGVFKVDISDPLNPTIINKIEGRTNGIDFGIFTDDQFSFPIGNLLMLCDDEVSKGCITTVHDVRPDIRPPEVMYHWPESDAVGLPPSTRVALSLSEPIDTRTLTVDNVMIVPLDGPEQGVPVEASFGFTGTVLNIDPAVPLAADTTYEVIAWAGGLRDLVGNPLSQDVRFAFSTGDQVAAVACEIAPLTPVVAGASTTLAVAASDGGATYDWALGDGQTTSGASTTASWPMPGRYAVRLTATAPSATGGSGAQRSCTAIQVVHRPLTEAPPTHSTTLAVDAANDRLWVVNSDANSVSELSLSTFAVLAEHDAGLHPRTIALDEAGRPWVTSQDDDTLVLLGDDTRTIALPWGCRPYGVAFTPDASRAFVSCEGSGEVLAFDGATGAPAGVAALYDDPWGPRPSLRGLAVVADGASVLATRYLSDASEGTVYQLDADSLAVQPAWSLAFDEGPDTNINSRGVPNKLSGLTISPDGVRVAIPSAKDNIARGLLRDGQPLGADSTVRTIVSWLDLETGAEDVSARIDLDDQDSAIATAFSPTGDLIFVATQGANKIDVYDAYDGRKVGGFVTGLGPQGLAVHDGHLFAHSALANTLNVIDIRGLLKRGDASAPRLAEVALTTRDTLTPEERLGKQIFYNANAREMTADGYISCASCHPDGGHDGQTWDFTDRGEGLRNTTDLRGKAGGHGFLHWSGNFDEVQDFEHDMRSFFGGAGLMDDADFFDGRDEPLGAPKAGVSPRLDALAAYVQSLDRYPRSPYRQPDGSLHEDAARGARLFERLGCETCHSGPDMTDSATGARHDVGTLTNASGGRLGGTLDGIDTPTLLGLHASAPYLHDGSAPTLDAVLANEAHVGKSLSDQQRHELAAYLLSLEGEPEASNGGCGCTTAPSAPLAAGGLLGLFALLRRPRRRGRRLVE